MKSFEKQLITRQPITHNILQLMGEIRECKGKQDLYKKTVPSDFEKPHRNSHHTEYRKLQQD